MNCCSSEVGRTHCYQFADEWLFYLLKKWCYIAGLALVSVAYRFNIWQKQMLYEPW